MTKRKENKDTRQTCLILKYPRKSVRNRDKKTLRYFCAHFSKVQDFFSWLPRVGEVQKRLDQSKKIQQASFPPSCERFSRQNLALLSALILVIGLASKGIHSNRLAASKNPGHNEQVKLRNKVKGEVCIIRMHLTKPSQRRIRKSMLILAAFKRTTQFLKEIDHLLEELGLSTFKNCVKLTVLWKSVQF